MNQQRFEELLSQVATWIKMLTPLGNPPPKTRSEDHPGAMCVITKLHDQPRQCPNCQRQCANMPKILHRRNMDVGYWLSRCLECSKYWNPRTNKFDLDVQGMSSINQYYKAVKEKESAATKSPPDPQE